MLDKSQHPDKNKHNNKDRNHVTLENFVLETGNPFIGKSIVESQIREKTQCLVMGVERDNVYIMNPEPTLVFMENDVILVAGETDKLRAFIG